MTSLQNKKELPAWYKRIAASLAEAFSVGSTEDVFSVMYDLLKDRAEAAPNEKLKAQWIDELPVVEQATLGIIAVRECHNGYKPPEIG